MKTLALVFAFEALVLATSPFGFAQQAGRVARIGFLGGQSTNETPDDAQRQFAPFHEGLRELGYVEGKTIHIERRYGSDDRARLRESADSLVHAKVDVIVTTGNRAALAAKEATATIPIVAASAGDLVGTGLVASLARPGGNLTGSTRMSTELGGKRIEILKDTLPRLARLAAILATRQDETELREMESPARLLNVRIHAVNVRDQKEFKNAFITIAKDRADALIIIHSGFTFGHRNALLELAAKNRLPAICDQSRWVDAGCLMSYGPDVPHLARRAAHFVDKILKGAKPADLPVEQPTKFEFIVNLKTAKQIGVTIPPNVLARATKVIR